MHRPPAFSIDDGEALAVVTERPLAQLVVGRLIEPTREAAAKYGVKHATVDLGEALALPGVDALATPLGEIEIDSDAVAAITPLRQRHAAPGRCRHRCRRMRPSPRRICRSDQTWSSPSRLEGGNIVRFHCGHLFCRQHTQLG